MGVWGLGYGTGEGHGRVIVVGREGLRQRGWK